MIVGSGLRQNISERGACFSFFLFFSRDSVKCVEKRFKLLAGGGGGGRSLQMFTANKRVAGYIFRFDGI